MLLETKTKAIKATAQELERVHPEIKGALSLMRKVQRQMKADADKISCILAGIEVKS